MAAHGRKRNKSRLPRLRVGTILAWADDYYRRHARWPTIQSRPIDAVPDENRCVVNACLRTAAAACRADRRWRGCWLTTEG
ncbi:MAG TPA: hypothetical protein VND64_07365 [Pirellulales bacterium]|nr:hypothetical protein [Pirellulales bacterium]